MSKGGILVSRPAYIVVVSSSLCLVTWRILLWRARKRVRKSVERIETMLESGGPLVRKKWKYITYFFVPKK